ncbi:MAG: hypothetical protein H8D52_01515 [Gammaproteobacteria bacterium]|nr:hypothetical protein [Gammaproteobacteria bacterium]
MIRFIPVALLLCFFSTFSGQVVAEKLHLAVYPGQEPGPSLLTLSLNTRNMETVADLAWLDSAELFEVAGDDPSQLHRLVFTVLAPPMEFDFKTIKGVRQNFVIKPALPDDVEVVAQITIEENVLLSNRVKVVRSKDGFRDAARVAILLKDPQILTDIGERLIKQQPGQTHGYRYRGFALEMQGRYAEAEEDIKTARTIFYENNPPVDADGRMIPNWEPPEILNRALRRIRAAQEG